MSTQGYRARLVFAWVLLACGAFLTAGSLGLWLERRDMSAGLVCMIVAIALLGPGAALLAGALATKARGLKLQRLSALGAAASRLPLGEIAADLEVPVTEARTLVLDAVSLGLLRGRMDLEAGVFLSSSAEGSVRPIDARCDACGATSTVVRIGTEPVRCPFCGDDLFD